MKVFLDTRAAVALYTGDRKLFGRRAADLAEHSVLFISPVVRFEIELLHEIGRLREGGDAIVRALINDWGVSVAEDSIAAVIAQTMPLAWTHDPFDRLLVARAALHRSPLITRDQKIHEHFPDAVW